jgi:hypothetical protein
VPLAIAPRDWQIERVDAPLRPPACPTRNFSPAAPRNAR